jgi:peptidoglycan/LPS O-acetylase OafA/YrhL
VTTTPTIDQPGGIESGAAPPAVAQRFPCIDGLRAIAALAVVLYHTVIHYNLTTSEYATWEWINRLGNFGVSTFFLISGFVLYRPYVLANFQNRPSPALGPFWKRRFLRIFPAYWVALTAAWILGYASIPDANTFFTGYGLLQNYRTGFTLFGLGVEWTLVIEVSFYLALPFIAMALRAAAGEHTTLERKLRGQLAGLAVLYLVAMATRVWSLWFLHAPAKSYGAWFPLGQVTSWLVGYLDWFALGMLFAVGSAWLACGRRLPRIAELLARYPAVCWLLMAESYWVALNLNLPASVFDPVTRIQSFGVAFVYGVVAFLLLYPAVFGPQDEGLIRRFLRSRPMHALGTISYGIYLWHLIFVYSVERWTRHGSVPENLFVWLAIIVPCTLAAATLSYHLVEKPLIRWSHRRRSELAVSRDRDLARTE